MGCSVFILAVLVVHHVECANILFISSVPSPSHHIFNRNLAFALSEKGHNVTMVTPDLEKRTHKNFHHIHLEGVYESLYEEFDINSMMQSNPFEAIAELFTWAKIYCYGEVKSKGLKQLMTYPKSFKVDLIIYDVTLGQCLYPIIDRFGRPPVVGITAFLLPPFLSNAMGFHVYPSYYPHYLFEQTNNMTFFERLKSFVGTYYEIWYRNNVFLLQQYEIMRGYFGEQVRTMEEYERDIDLLLSNIDPRLDYPLSIPPNVIPIGGMQLRPPNPLPKDLESVMENAKHGVILFSLGTNLKSSDLPSEVKEELLGAFSKLKQTVLWKYEIDITGLPKNVVVRKFLPQTDILGHPKCVLFITHGGCLSTQEAIYHGVPMIGIPGLADQHMNVHKLISKGFGLRIKFQNITRSSLHEAIKEVLDNPKYKNNIMAISKKYKDQPQTALDRAIFWSEYVMRHGGAKELSTPARYMPLYQTANLDVAAFLVFSVIIVFLAFYKIILVCCCQQKTHAKKKMQ